MGIVRSLIEVDNLNIHTICNGSFKENCYLIEDSLTRECFIIDPGSEFDFLINYIDKLHLKASMILLTHGHFDHIGAVEMLMEKYKIECEVSAVEKQLIRQAGIYAYRFNRQRLTPPPNLKYRNENNDIIWTGGTVKVMQTPGHTAGGLSYSFNSKAVFTGDTLFHSYIGPTNYPESDFVQLKASVNSLVNDLPGECLIFPGHGMPWLIKEAREWWDKFADTPPQFYILREKTS